MPELEMHVTADGWTIPADDTPKRITARQLAIVDGDEARVAKFQDVSVAGLRRRMTDDRLPPEPVIPAEIAAILNKPLPDMDAGLEMSGDGTEADLFRLCALTIEVCRDYIALDYFLDQCSLYTPPAWIEERRTQLHDALDRALDATAAVPALTWMGVSAKARVCAEWGVEPNSGPLDAPIVVSLLNDCGVFDRPEGACPGIIRRNYTPRARSEQFVETIESLDRIWSNPDLVRNARRQP